MNQSTVLLKLSIQGVVGAKVQGSVLVSCSLAPSSLTVPAGVQELASFCLSGQDNLEKVYLTGDVVKVGKACFANCPKLQRIVCDRSLQKFEKEMKSGNHAEVVYRKG